MATGYKDPVQAFKEARKEAASASSSWHDEVAIRERLNRSPFQAMCASWYFPGGGQFYLRQAGYGVLTILLYLAGLVLLGIICFQGIIQLGDVVESVSKWPDWAQKCVFFFGGWICYSLCFRLVSCIITFTTARRLHRQAEQDLEAFQRAQGQRTAP